MHSNKASHFQMGKKFYSEHLHAFDAALALQVSSSWVNDCSIGLSDQLLNRSQAKILSCKFQSLIFFDLICNQMFVLILIFILHLKQLLLRYYVRINRKSNILDRVEEQLNLVWVFFRCFKSNSILDALIFLSSFFFAITIIF